MIFVSSFLSLDFTVMGIDRILFMISAVLFSLINRSQFVITFRVTLVACHKACLATVWLLRV